MMVDDNNDFLRARFALERWGEPQPPPYAEFVNKVQHTVLVDHNQVMKTLPLVEDAACGRSIKWVE